jgi:hypothetical protein
MAGVRFLSAPSPEHGPPRAPEPDIYDIAKGAIDAGKVSLQAANAENHEPKRQLDEPENRIMFSLQTEGEIEDEQNAMRTLIRRYADEVTKGKRTKAHRALFNLEQDELIKITYKTGRNPNKIESITLTEEGRGYQVPPELANKFIS